MIARRYGVLPSTIAHLSAEDFVFNLLVASTGIEHERKEADKQKAKSQSQLGKLKRMK